MTQTPSNVLLSGVVGSTAYGLAHEDSDVDRLGVFAAPTAAFLGLGKPTESVVTTEPDVTFHEVGKWLRLALAGNPTVLELVWLDEYETVTSWGQALINIRESLLSAKRVRDAYLGYATQQFRRLQSREDGTFSSDTRKRTSKHARHMWRLLQQGAGLHQSGWLVVRLTPCQVEECMAFGDRVAAGDLEIATQLLKETEAIFDGPGCLPEQPNRDRAEGWLLGVRASFLLTPQP